MELETPFPYQQAGAQWLAERKQALLADEMGLGKSCQAVVGCDLVGARDILVICPAAVRINWAREFVRFSPFDRPIAVIETGKDPLPAAGVVIVSYDGATQRAKELSQRDWDVLVLDEAHYLKERSAKRTRAVYGHTVRIPGIAARSRRSWRLSGTPAPNNASELYTHMRSAGVADENYWDFTYRYCTGMDGTFGFKITGHKNMDELKSRLDPFMLRRTKDQVMSDLPPISYQEVTVQRSKVELDPYFYEQWRAIGQAKFIENLEASDKTLRMALDAIKHSPKPREEDKLTMIEGMAQSMVTLRRYIGMAKLPHICEILADELTTKALDKIVLFAVHKDVIETAREKLAKFGAVTLYGGTPADKRQRNIDKFMKDPTCRVFIGNIQAAGTGITLTAAHEVAFLEMDWVPANNAQAAMRCHRIGQTKSVRVRTFTLAGSVDEDVVKTLTRKTRELTKLF